MTRRRSQKAGLPAGSLVHVGEKKTERATITVISYGPKGWQETDFEGLHNRMSSLDDGTVTWINVNGIHDKSVVESLGQSFSLHPLLLEDVMNADQRPKLEEYDGYLFIVLRMLSQGRTSGTIEDEQLAIIFGHNFLISFQEGEPDELERVREIIRSGKGRLPKLGPDYLAYSLMDMVVDNYFAIMERIGEEIESLENEVMKNPKPETLRSIHRLKREIIFVRRCVWPLREVIADLQRRGTTFVSDSTSIYLRDLYDHIIHVIDTIETFRDIIAGMIDMYLSAVSNRMNEIMKVLTVIATIFIPLTWIVGIYGMNFDYMPELRAKFGYPVVMVFMIAIGVAMIFYFRRKKWF